MPGFGVSSAVRSLKNEHIHIWALVSKLHLDTAASKLGLILRREEETTLIYFVIHIKRVSNGF